MEKLAMFSLALLLAFSLVGFSVSDQAPGSSPTPTPELAPQSPSPDAPAPPVGSPVSLPSTTSPPAPPSDLAPGSSPTPSSEPSTSPTPSQTPSPSPTPAPSVSGKESHGLPESVGDGGDESSGGMSAGKKAGIVIGVILVAGMVGLGAMVYKKRRDNIRRARYMTAARRDFL